LETRIPALYALIMSRSDAEPGMSSRVSTDLVIETPENVVLTYRLAGPAVRVLAYLLDLMFRIAIVFAATILATWGGIISTGISTGLLLVLIFLVDWAYFGISEGYFRGKTLGKHLFGLRVVQEEGYPITFWGAQLRNIVRAADSLSFYGVGFVTMLVAGKFRRLGDLVARTVVIEERRVSVPREPVILAKIEPLPRTEMGGFVPSSQTLALIEEFLSRRHVLTYRRGHAMAYVLARALAKRLAFTGDPHLVDRYPMAFLARAYATFHQAHDDENDYEVVESAPPARHEPRRSPAGAAP
jgi:uncharacterized RDD family membrane protein YckC